MKNLLFFIAILLLLTTCKENCSNIDAYRETNFVFLITNKNGVNLITDLNSPYHKDSIKLLDDKTEIPIYKRKESDNKTYVFVAGVNYKEVLSSSKRLYLYLNHTDIDTLDISFTIYPNECNTVVTYEKNFHNNKLATVDNSGYYLFF